MVGVAGRRIDIEDRCVLRAVIDQGSSRINLQRSADHHTNVSLLTKHGCFFEHRYSLAEPNNMGSVAVFILIPIGCGQFFLPFEDSVRILQTPDFQKFSMEMEYLTATCPFMEIIDILRDDVNIKIIL